MRAVTVLCLLTGLLLAACGGDDGPAPFTPSQVARSFAQVTGDRLVTDPGASDSQTEVLRLEQGPADATVATARYGTFSIYVVKEGPAEPLYAQDLAGEPIEPTRDGIFWRRLSDSPPTWQASKRYRNVVLQWQAGPRRVADARFERLDAALGAIERPESARLPAQDRPCEQAGIDPLRGREGTCKLGVQTLVVVNRRHKLRLPTYDVARTRAEITRRVASSELLGFARAKGRYVVLRFTVRNRADEPLERVTPTLTVGERRYAPDSRALFLLQQRTPFPIQPDDEARVVAVFDIPPGAARQVGRKGALLVDGNPGGAAATIEGAAIVGRVRL